MAGRLSSRLFPLQPFPSLRCAPFRGFLFEALLTKGKHGQLPLPRLQRRPLSVCLLWERGVSAAAGLEGKGELKFEGSSLPKMAGKAERERESPSRELEGHFLRFRFRELKGHSRFSYALGLCDGPCWGVRHGCCSYFWLCLAGGGDGAALCHSHLRGLGVRRWRWRWRMVVRHRQGRKRSEATFQREIAKASLTGGPW